MLGRYYWYIRRLGDTLERLGKKIIASSFPCFVWEGTAAWFF